VTIIPAEPDESDGNSRSPYLVHLLNRIVRAAVVHKEHFHFAIRELPGDFLQALGQFLQVIRFVVHGTTTDRRSFSNGRPGSVRPVLSPRVVRYLIRLFYSWLSTRTRLVVPWLVTCARTLAGTRSIPQNLDADAHKKKEESRKMMPMPLSPMTRSEPIGKTVTKKNAHCHERRSNDRRKNGEDVRAEVMRLVGAKRDGHGYGAWSKPLAGE